MLKLWNFYFKVAEKDGIWFNFCWIFQKINRWSFFGEVTLYIPFVVKEFKILYDFSNFFNKLHRTYPYENVFRRRISYFPTADVAIFRPHVRTAIRLDLFHRRNLAADCCILTASYQKYRILPPEKFSPTLWRVSLSSEHFSHFDNHVKVASRRIGRKNSNMLGFLSHEPNFSHYRHAVCRRPRKSTFSFVAIRFSGKIECVLQDIKKKNFSVLI